MCFSLGASLGAGAILLAVGYAAVSLSRTPQQHVLCAIPLLFSFQQFTEALLWLALQHDSYSQWKGPPLYLYLLLAQVIWPVFLPLAVLLAEKEPLRKKAQVTLAAAGVITAACFSYGLLFYNADASITHHHIRYTLDFPLLSRWYGGILYLAAAMGAPVLSSNSRIRLIGAFLLASYLVTRFLYKDYLISVWCYFAAAISLVVLFDIIRQNRLHVSHRS
jgi:hypothetical protein